MLAFAGVHGVPVLGEALDTLGSLTTPAAMLIIGSSLANVPARQLVGGPRLMAASLVRLLVAPALMAMFKQMTFGDEQLEAMKAMNKRMALQLLRLDEPPGGRVSAGLGR